MTEEPSSFMMLLSDRRPNAEAMSAHDKGRVPRLEPRTMSEVDDESGGGHALVCTAGSKHVVPRALLRTPAAALRRARELRRFTEKCSVFAYTPLSGRPIESESAVLHIRYNYTVSGWDESILSSSVPIILIQ